MGRGLISLGLLFLLSSAWAQDGLDAGVDARAVASDGERSYLNGGLGDLRFDAEHDGLRFSSVWVDYQGSVHDVVHFVVDAVGYGDGDRFPLDLTEAYAELRPFPSGPWRSRVKLGAFYAPISLENWLGPVITIW